MIQEATAILKQSLPGTDVWIAAQAYGHINPATSACLLCQRQLDSSEGLEKHVRVSKLHAQNLEQAKATVLASLRSDCPGREGAMKRARH